MARGVKPEGLLIEPSVSIFAKTSWRSENADWNEVSESAEPAPTDKEKAFDNVIDVVKILTSLATGALVFSVGLVAPTWGPYPLAIKWLIVLSWVSFGGAVFVGLWALYSAPRLVDAGKADIAADEVSDPGGAQQLAFLLGIVFLAAALIAVMFTSSSTVSYETDNAAAAVHRAVGQLKPGELLQKVAMVELVKGTDPSNGTQTQWHVQLEVKARDMKPNDKPRIVDVYLSAAKMNDIYVPEPQPP